MGASLMPAVGPAALAPGNAYPTRIRDGKGSDFFQQRPFQAWAKMTSIARAPVFATKSLMVSIFFQVVWKLPRYTRATQNPWICMNLFSKAHVFSIAHVFSDLESSLAFFFSTLWPETWPSHHSRSLSLNGLIQPYPDLPWKCSSLLQTYDQPVLGVQQILVNSLGVSATSGTGDAEFLLMLCVGRSSQEVNAPVGLASLHSKWQIHIWSHEVLSCFECFDDLWYNPANPNNGNIELTSTLVPTVVPRTVSWTGSTKCWSNWFGTVSMDSSWSSVQPWRSWCQLRCYMQK